MAVRGVRGYLFAATGLCVAAGAFAAPQPAPKKPASRVQPPPPVRITPKRTATMTAPRHLALIGVTRIGDRSQAWLVNRNTQMRATVAPGQTVFGYQVKQIDGERVVFTQNGRQFSLRLGENPEPQSLVAGYQSELRASAPTGSASASPTLESTATPPSPENRTPAARSTTVIEVNPVTEVREVPPPATANTVAPSPLFDPNLAGATFYPGLGTGYPGFLPLYSEEAVYPGTMYGPAAYGTLPYAANPYGAAQYPTAPYPGAPYSTAPYPAAPTFDQGFYPGEGIVRGRFSGNYPGYGPFAPPYPSGQPRGVYSSDWPQDLRFIPAQRGNPQTFRRRSGDYGGEGYSNNPQTRRRRQYHDR